MTLLHIVVVSSAILSVGPRSRRWPAVLPLIALLAAVACVFIDCGFNRTVLTIVGIPSITSIAIVCDYAIGRAFGRSLLASGGRRMLGGYLAVGSLIFYPSAMGMIHVDLYRFGFNGAAPAVLALAGIVLAAFRLYGPAAVVLAALLALDVHLLPSLNAFDYVIDPFGGLIALGWAAVRVVKLLIARLRAPRAAAGDLLEPAT